MANFEKSLAVKVGLGLLGAFIVIAAWSIGANLALDIPYQFWGPFSIFRLMANYQLLDWYALLVVFSPIISIASLGLVAIAVKLSENPNAKLYGNAHFAGFGEMKRAGFYQETGNIIVGKKRGKFLRYQLTNHLMMFAPSRSGKGVSLVIPNALNWKGSLLVTDNKYEVFEYTSGYREQCGNKVFRFSPASNEFRTHRINPLDYIDRENPSKRITDLHLILDILIADCGNDNKMWAEEARSIALGILLWLMDSDRPFTLGEFASIIKGGEELSEFLERILKESIIADNLITLPHASFLAIQNFVQKAPKEQSGVRSTLTSMIRLWEDPLICAATSSSDVDFRCMRKEPTTLYLSFGTNQIERLAPLINLIIQLFLNVMLAHLPRDDEPYKVLALLDEINRFGRMNKLKDSFGDLAGYGVHLLPIIQNVGQFYSTYGSRDNCDIFFQNTDLKIGFRQNTATDRELLSKELGNKTVRLKTRSYASNKAGSNYNESFIERPLLTPYEIGELDRSKQVIITGDVSILADKIIYYKDKTFLPKLLSPITVPAVTPEYPIINVRKETDEIDNGKVQDNLEKKKMQIQAREIGRSLAGALGPLVDKAIAPKSNKQNLIIDKETGEIFQNLSDAFEEGETA